MTFRAVEKLAAAEREVKQREHVYPRLIDAGKMSSAKAAHEIAVMREIADDYRQAVEKERLI